MKVLMIARPDLYKVKGGDTIQINETASGLAALGVQVDIKISGEIDYSNYDLIHFFNIIDPEDILGHVLKSKLPYVVSPIYVDYREYDKLHRKDMVGLLSKFLPRDTIEYFKTLAKYIFKNEKISTSRFFLMGHKRAIKYILKHAALLLPNSESEYKRLEKDYEVDQKYKVVPNAINPVIFQTNENVERDIVLCVARLEGRKNQLNIINALNNSEYKVVFIGAASSNQKKYVHACRNQAGSNIQFIDEISQQDLLQYYNRSRVHVLASWFETTGLSNLEAGAMGCHLVIGDRGDVREYFGNHAFYCEPGNPLSIKAAVDKAWNAPKNNVIQKQIFNNFTWNEAAKITCQAYKQVLNV